jgi:hypothetical protein
METCLDCSREYWYDPNKKIKMRREYGWFYAVSFDDYNSAVFCSKSYERNFETKKIILEKCRDFMDRVIEIHNSWEHDRVDVILNMIEGCVKYNI